MNFPLNADSILYDATTTLRTGLLYPTTTKLTVYETYLSSVNNATKPAIYCGTNPLSVQLSSGVFEKTFQITCNNKALYWQKFDNNDAYFTLTYATGTPDWGVQENNIYATSSSPINNVYATSSNTTYVVASTSPITFNVPATTTMNVAAGAKIGTPDVSLLMGVFFFLAFLAVIQFWLKIFTHVRK